MSFPKSLLMSYTAVNSVRAEVVIASQTGTEALPQPIMPKRSALASVIDQTFLRHFFAVEPADEIGIGVVELCLSRERSHETVLL